MARSQASGLEAKAQAGKESWKNSRIVIKAEELDFKTSPGGTVAIHVNSNNGFANRQIGGFIREIPPGWKSGNHRHNMEAIIHILGGTGYTMIDGTKYEWKAGDTVSVPPMSEHQHFNPDPKLRALFFAVHTAEFMGNVGAFEFLPTGDAGKIEG